MTWTSGKAEWCGGGEAGHREAYFDTANSTASADVSTAIAPRTGTYTFRINAAAGLTSYFNLTLSDSVTSLGFAFAFNLTTSDGSENPTLFAPGGGLGVPILRIFGNSGTRKLRMYEPFGHTNVMWTGGQTISLATWYVLTGFLFKEGNAYWPTRVKLWDSAATSLLDDSDWRAQASGSSSAANFNSVYFGSFPDFGVLTTAHDYHYDDIILTTSSPPPTGAKIVGVVPTGNSATDNGWVTGTAGNKWDDTDEIPPDDDTTYIKRAGGTGNAQTFTHAAITDPGASGNPLLVDIRSRNRNDGAGTHIWQNRIRTSAGAGNLPQSGSAGATYAYARLSPPQMFSVGGIGWNKGGTAEGDVDNLEFGVNQTLTNGRCTQSHMEVAWGANWANSGNEKFFTAQRNRGVW